MKQEVKDVDEAFLVKQKKQVLFKQKEQVLFKQKEHVSPRADLEIINS